MIEAMIRNYLMTVLSVPVYIEVPSEPPGSYVVIERTGGGIDEHIRSAMIAVQSYGTTRLEAATLHETILEKLPDIATGSEVTSCEVNAEYDYTDTETKRHRYQAVFDIVYY